MRRAGFALVVAACLFGAGASGCFNPDRPACAFSCIEPPHTCPTGFTCGADNLCHDPTSTAFCGLDLADASTSDGADAAQDEAQDQGRDGNDDVTVDAPSDSADQ